MVYWNRFISYLFRYHNYDKCENTGFAKVQKYTNQGKIYIGLKDNLNRKDGIYLVYFYRETLASSYIEHVREDMKKGHTTKADMVPVPIYLGKLKSKSGRVEGEILFDWNDVMGSGRPITACSGIIIKRYDGNDDLFCSSWTDNHVDYSMAFREEEPEDIFTGSLEEREPKELGVGADTAWDPGNESSTDFSTESSSLSESDRNVQEPSAEPDMAEEQEVQEPSAEPDMAKEQEVQALGVGPDVAWEPEETASAETENIRAERTILDSLYHETEDRTEELFNSREKLPLLPDLCMENGENCQVVECVKITPNDIGLLNMDNWRLGVNSFLTHGYYSYHYLMIGRVSFGNEPEGKKYILGVPGEYSSKEKYLANIFGFERFIPVKEREIKTGGFGYYVVDLK